MDRILDRRVHRMLRPLDVTVSICSDLVQYTRGTPIHVPFLVKKAVPRMKLIPQPMTSPTPKRGPNDLPRLLPTNKRPSSPWYPHDSDSQPGNLDRDTFLVENPIPIAVFGILNHVR